MRPTPKKGYFYISVQDIYVCCAFNSRVCFFLTEQCFLAWSRTNRLSILSSKHWTGLHGGPTSTSTSTFSDGNKSLQHPLKHLVETTTTTKTPRRAEAFTTPQRCPLWCKDMFHQEISVIFFPPFASRCVFGLACGLRALNPDMFVMPCVQIQIKFQFVGKHAPHSPEVVSTPPLLLS